jgi:DNA-binding CsgD family transcriptional regulator
MEGKRGRPPYPQQVTPAESRVLELVRAGVPNAEIAVRLGLSVNTVRYHVSNLLSKAGVPDRKALACWQPRDEQSGRGWLWFSLPRLLAIISTAGVCLVAATVLLTIASDDAAQPGTGAANAAPSMPATVMIGGRVMADLGPLFISADGGPAVHSTEPREGYVIAELAPGATLASNGRLGWNNRDVSVRAGGTADLAAQTVPLELSAATEDTKFDGNPAISMKARTRSGSAPSVIVWVKDHHSEIGPRGNLYVEVSPIDSAAVLAEDTGERLNVGQAATLGSIGSAWTICAAPGTQTCYVLAYYDRDSVRAPVPGTFVCRPDGVDELVGATLRLEFRHLWAGHPDLPCESPGSSRAVDAGDPLFPSIHTLING